MADELVRRLSEAYLEAPDDSQIEAEIVQYAEGLGLSNLINDLTESYNSNLRHLEYNDIAADAFGALTGSDRTSLRVRLIRCGGRLGVARSVSTSWAAPPVEGISGSSISRRKPEPVLEAGEVGEDRPHLFADELLGVHSAVVAAVVCLRIRGRFCASTSPAYAAHQALRVIAHLRPSGPVTRSGLTGGDRPF